MALHALRKWHDTNVAGEQTAWRSRHFRHRGRTRREPLVHGDRREQGGQTDHLRRLHRILCSDRQQLSLWHRRGPNGNLWFTELDGNKVAKVVAGVASRPAVPPVPHNGPGLGHLLPPPAVPQSSPSSRPGPQSHSLQRSVAPSSNSTALESTDLKSMQDLLERAASWFLSDLLAAMSIRVSSQR